jgi:hypothetical protein
MSFLKNFIPAALRKRIKDTLVFAPNDPYELLQVLPPRHKEEGVDRYKKNYFSLSSYAD